MKALIKDGALGDLIGVELRCHFPLIRDGDAVFPFVTRPGYTSNYNWLGMTGEGASALRNLGGHCLHALIYLFGDVASVSATLERGLREWRFDDGSHFEPQTVDTAFLTLRFRHGGMAQMNIGWSVAGARGFALEAYGSKGRLRIEAPSGFPDAANATLSHAPAVARADLGRAAQPVTLPNSLTQLRGADIPMLDDARVIIPMTLMLDEMVSAVRENRDCHPGFEQALQVQAICEAAEESERSGQRVTVVI